MMGHCATASYLVFWMRRGSQRGGAAVKKIYYEIYEDLRDKIIAGTYTYQTYIPSENTLVEVYQCSHNTLRKALSVLALHGFVQPVRGRGVLVIYQPHQRANFVLGDIETFAEAAARNGFEAYTTVPLFERVVADLKLAVATGFSVSDELLHIERIRNINGRALVRDHSYFLASALPGLTREIAEQSIYSYAEQKLGIDIATSNRVVTVEFATPDDRKYLDLLDFDMLAVVSNRTFTAQGVMFESTQSRHRPDYFTFHDTAVRGY